MGCEHRMSKERKMHLSLPSVAADDECGTTKFLAALTANRVCACCGKASSTFCTVRPCRGCKRNLCKPCASAIPSSKVRKFLSLFNIDHRRPDIECDSCKRGFGEYGRWVRRVAETHSCASSRGSVSISPSLLSA